MYKFYPPTPILKTLAADFDNETNIIRDVCERSPEVWNRTIQQVEKQTLDDTREVAITQMDPLFKKRLKGLNLALEDK